MRSRLWTSIFLVSYLFPFHLSLIGLTTLVHDYKSCLADGDEDPSRTRMDKINALGEFLAGIRTSGKKFIVKFFPEKKKALADLFDLPDALDEAVAHQDDKLRSAEGRGKDSAWSDDVP